MKGNPQRLRTAATVSHHVGKALWVGEGNWTRQRRPDFLFNERRKKTPMPSPRAVLTSLRGKHFLGISTEHWTSRHEGGAMWSVRSFTVLLITQFSKTRGSWSQLEKWVSPEPRRRQ